MRTILASVPTDATDATFEQDVIRRSHEHPVVVDFWAEWCGPCRQLTPVLEKAVSARGDQMELVKIDTDANPMVSPAFKIQSIPAVKVLRTARSSTSSWAPSPAARSRSSSTGCSRRRPTGSSPPAARRTCAALSRSSRGAPTRPSPSPAWWTARRRSSSGQRGRLLRRRRPRRTAAPGGRRGPALGVRRDRRGRVRARPRRADQRDPRERGRAPRGSAPRGRRCLG